MSSTKLRHVPAEFAHSQQDTQNKQGSISCPNRNVYYLVSIYIRKQRAHGYHQQQWRMMNMHSAINIQSRLIHTADSNLHGHTLLISRNFKSLPAMCEGYVALSISMLFEIIHSLSPASTVEGSRLLRTNPLFFFLFVGPCIIIITEK